MKFSKVEFEYFKLINQNKKTFQERLSPTHHLNHMHTDTLSLLLSIIIKFLLFVSSQLRKTKIAETKMHPNSKKI